MKRDFLEKYSLEAKDIDEIMAEYGKSIKAEKDKVAGWKTSYDELKETLNGVDIEALKKDSDDWKTKYEDLEKQISNEKAERAFNDLLSKSFTKYNVLDDKAVRVHLDESKINDAKDDEAKAKELDAQLTEIKESKSYLFKAEETGIGSAYTYAPGNGTGNDDSDKAIANAINGIY